MRYFRVVQHRIPENMYNGIVSIKALEETAKEITKEEAETVVHWGSGNLEVDPETEKYKWIKTDFDSSD